MKLYLMYTAYEYMELNFKLITDCSIGGLFAI